MIHQIWSERHPDDPWAAMSYQQLPDNQKEKAFDFLCLVAIWLNEHIEAVPHEDLSNEEAARIVAMCG